jgi:tetratricopeptide (TPR) repeat protein
MVSVALCSPAQGFTVDSIRQGLMRIDTSRRSARDKLAMLYVLKERAETQRLPADSFFARVLHKIGAYEFVINKRYSTALEMTQRALRINTSGRVGASLNWGASDMYNMAYFSENLGLHKKALIYYDSAILIAARSADIDEVMTISWVNKAYIYFRMGDYEKAVEEGERARVHALKRLDSTGYLYALNQRAQALCLQGKLSLAAADVKIAISLARLMHADFHLAGALKSQALIYSALKDYPKAEASYQECIATRIRSKVFQQVAGDYNDMGIFYGDTLREYRKANDCYRLAIRYGKQEGDSVRMARASVNLAGNYVHQGMPDSAIYYYSQTMNLLNIGQGTDFTRNPKSSELSAMGNKELIQDLFDSKSELLLRIYRQTRDAKWLSACLQTALLTDSLIRDIRHEQLGEQSKLYWRDKTRGFFASALEACYLAHDDRLAFYFMEESRSVLLLDKLNELGANAYLPPEEAAKGERVRIRIVELQQKLGTLGDTSSAGREVVRDLLAAKGSLEQNIRELERDYPAYYQYKYADEVLPLTSLQEFLSKNNQNFVEYFTQDTLCFALCVQPSRTTLLRIVDGRPGIEERLLGFARSCSDEDAMNRDLPAFLANANGLYHLLLEPFHLPGGRVILCQDNGLIPFEALSSDPARADYLVKEYSFSYVYSAQYLMRRADQGSGKGDFLGIAPVNFAAFNGMADLRLSEQALRNCSTPFHRVRLLLHADASRQNFISQVCDYNTATILTHARADSADEEPVLFMNDSVIHLSELQLLGRPAVRLIILSACQTNAGKNRSGEGIFSLARGFSAVGIPAVAATQWMADESAIYSISQKFNEFIAVGMTKDEALRKAKLFYMYEDRHGSLLPCYWADMILIGNTDPVRFERGWNVWFVVTVSILVFLLGGVALYLVRRLRGGS